MQIGAKKSGKVLLLGRPNVGKSTLVNNLIGQKVAITSPKAQTTRFPIRALLEDERGTIVFIDTPGIFAKAEDRVSKKINQQTMGVLDEDVDAVIYMVDQSRKRDFEESKVLGMVRKLHKPTLLVINKVDKEGTSFAAQYQFMKNEFPYAFEISALKKLHFPPLLDALFALMPDKPDDERLQTANPYPVINIDSKTFIAELIREKVFIMMGEEIPYTTTAIVDDIKNRSDQLTYVKARILTTEPRHKKMLIGNEGRKIKEIGSYARKEIALAIGRKVYLDLTVEVDSHWQELY